MAANEISRRLKTLHFTMVKNEFIDDRILEYIGKMPVLKVRLARWSLGFILVLWMTRSIDMIVKLIPFVVVGLVARV